MLSDSISHHSNFKIFSYYSAIIVQLPHLDYPLTKLMLKDTSECSTLRNYYIFMSKLLQNSVFQYLFFKNFLGGDMPPDQHVGGHVKHTSTLELEP